MTNKKKQKQSFDENINENLLSQMKNELFENNTILFELQYVFELFKQLIN